MSEKKYESKPAGVNDKIEVTYTNFATNRERTEARTGEGKEFDNEELLRLLGFKENSQGEMTLSATSIDVEKDKNGKVIRRTKNGRTLTDNRQAGTER